MKFSIPSEVRKHVPDDYKIDLKTYLTMEYVAKSVSKEGNPFEFRLKIHPQSHKLPFLDSNHKLHHCYKFLQNHSEYYLYNNDKLQVPELLYELYEQIFSGQNDTNKTMAKLPSASIIEGYSDSE